MNGIVIIYEKGTGKTRRAEELRKHYGCKRVVDEWDGEQELKNHDLVITNLQPPFNVDGARTIKATKAKLAITSKS